MANAKRKCGYKPCSTMFRPESGNVGTVIYCSPECKILKFKTKPAVKARAKKKARSISKLVDDVAVLMQKLVRLKAANGDGYCKCVTCGNVYHWKAMNGGHYISRKYQGTKITEENIHSQCVACNGFPDNFVYANYDSYMKAMYGPEFVETLKLIAKQPASFDRKDLEQKTVELSAQIDELEAKL